MIRLPLGNNREVCIFGKNISVHRSYVRKVIPKGDGEDMYMEEIVKVEDGTHGNGGWETTLRYEDAIDLIRLHCNGEN